MHEYWPLEQLESRRNQKAFRLMHSENLLLELDNARTSSIERCPQIC